MSEQMGGAAPPGTSPGDPEVERSGRSRSRVSLTRAVVGLAVILVLGWCCLTLWERRRAAERAASEAGIGRSAREDPDARLMDLVKGLGDADAAVRAASATALVSLVTSGDAVHRDAQVRIAVTSLLPCLDDPQPAVRAAAVKAVWMGIVVGRSPATKADLEPIMAPLIERLGDADSSVRLEAIHGLGNIGPRVSDAIPDALLHCLEDESEPNRDAAALAVAAYRGGLADLLPTMVQSLETGGPQFRGSFLKILEAVHPRRLPPQAISGFIAALGSRDLEVVRLAVSNLSAFETDAGSATPELGRRLDQLLALGKPGVGPSGPRNPDIVVKIIDCLRVVARGSTEQKDAVSALSKALRTDQEPDVRLAAAKTLGQFRPDPALFNALTEYVGDRDPAVRHEVLIAIQHVNFAEGYVLPKALAVALDDPSAETRVDAANAMCHAGLGADPFVPALVQHGLHDPVREVRGACGSALSQLSNRRMTTSSIRHLIEGLDSTDPDFREGVFWALARFGPDAAPAIPALLRLLKEPVDKVHWRYHGSAASALGQIAPGTTDADRVIPTLIEVLQSDRNGWTTCETISALARFGPKASRAVPRLRELQKHADDEVRKAATKALETIQSAG